VDIRCCGIFTATEQSLDEIREISRHPVIAYEISIATLRSP